MQRVVVALAIAFVFSTLLVVAGVRANGRRTSGAEALASRGGATALAPLWSAPDFRLRDQEGRTVTLASFSSDVWVATFIFTQCRAVCPLLTSQLVQLQRRLAGVRARFVSFSVDPAHDSPEVLRDYAARWAPGESRWTLLATDDASLGRLAAGFRVTAEKSADPVDPILHTSVFLLVDGGQIRGVFHGDSAESVDALERAVRQLAGAATSAPAAAKLPSEGADLYHALSCANCHERADLAPPLVDLAGRRRELDDGSVVVADAAFVRESIVEPDAKRARGYALRMPSYRGTIDDVRLESLVTWIMARRSIAPARAGEADVAVVEDPVCHMKVRVDADAPTARVGERTLHFCSAQCRDRFIARSQQRRQAE